MGKLVSVDLLSSKEQFYGQRIYVPTGIMTLLYLEKFNNALVDVTIQFPSWGIDDAIPTFKSIDIRNNSPLDYEINEVVYNELLKKLSKSFKKINARFKKKTFSIQISGEYLMNKSSKAEADYAKVIDILLKY